MPHGFPFYRAAIQGLLIDGYADSVVCMYHCFAYVQDCRPGTGQHADAEEMTHRSGARRSVPERAMPTWTNATSAV